MSNLHTKHTICGCALCPVRPMRIVLCTPIVSAGVTGIAILDIDDYDYLVAVMIIVREAHIECDCAYQARTSHPVRPILVD